MRTSRKKANAPNWAESTRAPAVPAVMGKCLRLFARRKELASVIVHNGGAPGEVGMAHQAGSAAAPTALVPAQWCPHLCIPNSFES